MINILFRVSKFHGGFSGYKFPAKKYQARFDEAIGSQLPPFKKGDKLSDYPYEVYVELLEKAGFVFDRYRSKQYLVWRKPENEQEAYDLEEAVRPPKIRYLSQTDWEWLYKNGLIIDG
jgi:hypothetical protein